MNNDLRVFRSVGMQCEFLKGVLGGVKDCPAPSEGLCRSHLSEALGAPLCMRYDTVLRTCGCILMNNSDMIPDELTHKVFLELARMYKRYGDTMDYPQRSFSDCSIIDQINLKIDDKLCIVYNSKESIPDSVYLDIMCYIILYRTAVVLHDDRFYKRAGLADLMKRGGIFLLALLATGTVWLYIMHALTVQGSRDAAFGIIALALLLLGIFCAKEYKRNKFTEDPDNE